MEKHKYTGKTKEEAISNATIDLQETKDNLIIKELEEIKGGLFKSKKVEIEVIEKREVVKYIKEYLNKLLKNLVLQQAMNLILQHFCYIQSKAKEYLWLMSLIFA